MDGQFSQRSEFNSKNRAKIHNEEIGFESWNQATIQQVVTWKISPPKVFLAFSGLEENNIRGKCVKRPKWTNLNDIEFVIGQVTRLAQNDNIIIRLNDFPARIHLQIRTSLKKFALRKACTLSHSVPRVDFKHLQALRAK